MSLQWLSPRQYPTWHEASFRPATPEHMHLILSDEAAYGCRGEFGHHFWGEQHPSFTMLLMGFVWLPGVEMFEVPSNMRADTIVDEHGKVFLRAIVDESVVPSWVS